MGEKNISREIPVAFELIFSMISFVLVHISCYSLSFLVIIVRLCMFSFFSILYYHMSKHIQISLSLNICLQHQMAMKKSSCRVSTLGVPIQTCVERNEITMTINVINKSKIHFSALNRVQTYFIFIFLLQRELNDRMHSVR